AHHYPPLLVDIEVAGAPAVNVIERPCVVYGPAALALYRCFSACHCVWNSSRYRNAPHSTGIGASAPSRPLNVYTAPGCAGEMGAPPRTRCSTAPAESRTSAPGVALSPRRIVR